MPELPEVETVVRGLRELIIGSEITAVDLRGDKLKKINPHNFATRLTGRKFIAIHRRGKNIIIDLSGQLSLWAHLKMTGRFVDQPVDQPGEVDLDKHDHLSLEYRAKRQKKKRRLVFRDVRKFGFVKLIPTPELYLQEGLSKLGAEPLEIERAEFVELFSARKRTIKPALLDQTLIAGIGNIYADEALYFARIHPQKMTNEISAHALGVLHREIQRILKLAIKRMGTTFDSYAGVNGNPGNFQNYLNAYGREGEPCSRCGKPITRLVIGQRSAHFCNNCQPF